MLKPTAALLEAGVKSDAVAAGAFDDATAGGDLTVVAVVVDTVVGCGATATGLLDVVLARSPIAGATASFFVVATMGRGAVATCGVAIIGRDTAAACVWALSGRASGRAPTRSVVAGTDVPVCGGLADDVGTAGRRDVTALAF